jgi:hypothetical protein
LKTTFDPKSSAIQAFWAIQASNVTALDWLFKEKEFVPLQNNQHFQQSLSKLVVDAFLLYFITEA